MYFNGIAIVAVCANNGIGKDGKIPWRCKEDLQYFSKLTKGSGNNSIIMGRKTWESLPKFPEPLPGRTNIVLTSQTDYMSTNLDKRVVILNNKSEIIKYCIERRFEENWIIGGSDIYREFMDVTTKLYMNRIEDTYECDVFFPDTDSFTEVYREKCEGWSIPMTKLIFKA